MDWVLFTQSGSITSISQGYTYIYVGSELGGVFRFNVYSDEWEDPLTVAQGLPDNSIESVYFDSHSGMLWIVTPEHISYSYDREGNWFHVDKSDLSINPNTTIRRMGSTKDFIWVEAGALYLKLDRTSGVLLGSFPTLDVADITWNSVPMEFYSEFPPTLQDFTITDGWILMHDQFIDDVGRDVFATTMYRQKNGNLWIGTDNGHVLVADATMDILRPHRCSISNTNVTTILGSSSLYLAGYKDPATKGISYFDLYRNIVDWIEPEITINLPGVSFTSGLLTDKHLWFGSSGSISVYNKKHDYWKTVTSQISRWIYAMERDSGAVWVGGNRGVERFDETYMQSFPFDMASAFDGMIIYDIDVAGNDVWFSTDQGLWIYNKKNGWLLPPSRWTHDTLDVFLTCWNVIVTDTAIYTATNAGIHQWNRLDHRVKLVVDPSLYQSRPVSDLEFVDDFFFIGTDNGLFRVQEGGRGFQHYNYPFIRQVNDVYISDEDCWLGTDQGLVWFNWKRDI